jgi:hypothetical protein
MRLGRIVEPSAQTANGAGPGEAQQGHADGLRITEIDEIGRRKCPAKAFPSDAISNASARCHGVIVLSEL